MDLSLNSNPHLYKVLLEILAGDSEAHGDPAPLAPKIECSEDETCISLLQNRSKSWFLSRVLMLLLRQLMCN